MHEGHALRKLALEACAAPHVTHAELLAKHHGAPPQVAPKASPRKPAKGYTVGYALGRSLKGLFGKKD